MQRERSKKHVSQLKMAKPSQREKKRYIVYEIKATEKFEFSAVKKTIFDVCHKYIGEFGVYKARLNIMANTYSNNKGIFRVTNRQANDVKECIAMIKEINGKKASMDIIGISGILKKAKNKFLRLNKRGR